MTTRKRPRFAQPVARRLDRRSFGRAIGVGLIAAPFLRLLRAENAVAAIGNAKRLAVIITGGTSPAHSKMTGSSAESLVTNTWNSGLARIKDKCVVVDGLKGDAKGHGEHWGLLQTGYHYDGNTVDRIVMNHLLDNGNASPIQSLLLGSDVDDSMSPFREATNGAGGSGSVPALTDPLAAHQLVFGGFEPVASDDTASLAATLAKNQSMLDAVRADLNELHAMLGVQERSKLEAHLESLRQYEMRLYTSSPSGAGCSSPTSSASNDAITIAKAQMLLAHAALACDISRVVGVAWGQDNRLAINLPEIGVVNNIHDLAHDFNLIDKFEAWEDWFSHQLADFVELLANTADPESDGTLLDTTLVCFARNIADAVNHNFNDAPLVFAGGPSILKTTPNGRYVDAAGAEYRKGLACVAAAFGQTDAAVTGGHTPIDGVLA